MRRLRIVLLASLALAAAPAAAAGKEGAMLSPALSALVPGEPTLVQVIVAPVYEGRHQVVAPPRDGARPVLVLEPLPAGKPLRFAVGPLRGSAGWAKVTVPRGRRDYHDYVLVGEREYPVGMQPVFTAGADAILPDPPAKQLAVSRAGAGSDDVPAWPFVLAGGLASLGVGVWWRRRQA
jgi:hypothetical protein